LKNTRAKREDILKKNRLSEEELKENIPKEIQKLENDIGNLL